MSDETAPIRLVSEKDREYMRRLGEFEAENERRELAEHVARSARERLVHSINMGRAMLASGTRTWDGGLPLALHSEAQRRGLSRR